MPFHLAVTFAVSFSGHVCRHIEQAIYFFQRSQRFNHAVRLAKQHDMAGELTMLSMHAPPKLMVEAAEYFEARNMAYKAVALYQKGGNLSKVPSRTSPQTAH